MKEPIPRDYLQQQSLQAVLWFVRPAGQHRVLLPRGSRNFETIFFFFNNKLK